MVKKKRNNKKVIFTILATISLLVLSFLSYYLYTIFSNKIVVEKGTLEVITSDWSGWMESQPKDKKSSHKISEGTILKFDSLSMGQPLSFEITRLTTENIDILLPQGVVKSNDGINLAGKDRQTLSIKTNGEKQEACTQTLDAGTCFTFYYNK